MTPSLAAKATSPRETDRRVRLANQVKPPSSIGGDRAFPGLQYFSVKGTWILLFLALWGCDSGGATLVLDLRTDWVAGREFNRVRIDVLDSNGDRIDGAQRNALASDRFLDGERIAEIDLGHGQDEVLVETTLMGSDGLSVIQRTRVQTSAAVQAVTVLITRSCESIRCEQPGMTACIGGTCVPESCGSEEGAASCPVTDRCIADANCVASPACVLPRCVSQVCLYEVRDAECGDGICDPDLGCSEPPPDAGLPDAGAPDAGMPDAGAPDSGTCGTSPCRLTSPQCGCPAGQACHVVSGAPPACVMSGSTGLNEPCGANEQCQPGMFCNSNMTPRGVCGRYCETSADCGGEPCVQLDTMSPAGACPLPCDPVDGTGCGDPSLGCRVGSAVDFVTGANAPIQACFAVDGLAFGEPCDGLCGPRGLCVGGTCRQVCDLASSVCESGSCRRLSLEIRIGSRELGACL